MSSEPEVTVRDSDSAEQVSRNRVYDVWLSCKRLILHCKIQSCHVHFANVQYANSKMHEDMVCTLTGRPDGRGQSLAVSGH